MKYINVLDKEVCVYKECHTFIRIGNTSGRIEADNRFIQLELFERELLVKQMTKFLEFKNRFEIYEGLFLYSFSDLSAINYIKQKHKDVKDKYILGLFVKVFDSALTPLNIKRTIIIKNYLNEKKYESILKIRQ